MLETLIPILSINMQLRWPFSKIIFVWLALTLSLGWLPQAKAKSVEAKSIATKSIETLALRQTCRMLGECDVLLSNAGLKMTLKKSGLICLLLPPYNEVICYSQASGKIFRTPFAKFRNAFSTSMTLFSFTLEDVKLEAEGNLDKFGLPLHKLQSTASFDKAQVERHLKHEASGGAPVKLHYVGSDQLKFDHHQAMMMERLYAVPRAGMFPISVDYKSAEGDYVNYLLTAKVIKSTVPLTEFAIPSHLKPAKEMQETLESGSSDEAMQLMMGK